MKTGGLRGALKTMAVARALDLQIMLSCMVESSVGVTAAAHIAPLADYCDLDGPLLIANDPFVGLRYEGAKIILPDGPGLGLVANASNRNPDKTIALVCVLVCVAGVAAALLPSLTGMDMMRSGYGLTCLAGFVALAALIAALVFFGRAAAWDRLARGQDVLAHWIYSEAEWQAYAQVEFEEESTRQAQPLAGGGRHCAVGRRDLFPGRPGGGRRCLAGDAGADRL